MSAEAARDLLGRGPGDGITAAVASWLSPDITGTCQELLDFGRPSIPDSFDAVHYRIEINDVDEPSRAFTARTTAFLVPLRDLSALDLNLSGLEVSAVSVQLRPGGGFLSTTYSLADSLLHIDGLGGAGPGDTLVVQVDYGGTEPTCISVNGLSAGVVFSAVGVHSFSEPNYAHHWYPCHDVPWDKATFVLVVTAPAGRVPSAPGVLTDSTDVSGRQRKTWAIPRPMSTYLAAFYLGDYVKLGDASPEGVPLEYFVFPDLVDEAAVDFENVPDMMSFYSSFYPYPYPRYAMTLGFFPGGMEHVMNSLIANFVIRGDRSQEPLFAHEMAHQWWGDLVTVEAWREIWLNEGFATFFEHLYTEHRYGWNAMRAITARVDSVYMANLEILDHPILDPPLERLFSFVVYQKGRRVLDMLRGVSRLRLLAGPPRPPAEHAGAALAGDARFFDIFGAYAAAHAYGSVSTADFQSLAETALGEDLEWFFQPWLHGLAYPRLAAEVSSISSEGKTHLDVRVAQVQPSTLFTMPVHVRYVSGSRVLDEVREIAGPTTTWAVDLPVGEWDLILDPDDWLLDQHTVERLAPTAGSFEASPNPSRSGFDLRASVAGSGSVPAALVITDLQGREVRSWHYPSVPAGFIQERWDGRTQGGEPAAAGIYLARMEIGSTAWTRKLVLLR